MREKEKRKEGEIRDGLRLLKCVRREEERWRQKMVRLLTKDNITTVIDIPIDYNVNE